MLNAFEKVKVCENILSITDDGEIFKKAAEMRAGYIHAGWLENFGVVAACDRASAAPSVGTLIEAFEACDRAWFYENCDGDVDLYSNYYQCTDGGFYSIDEIEYAASIFGRYLASDEMFIRTLYGLFADLAGVPHPTGVLNAGYAARNLAWLCEAYTSHRPWAEDVFRVYAPFDGVVPEGISCPSHSAAHEGWTARQVPDSWDDMPQYEWENLPVHESMGRREVAYA